jgi:hypothetical protein
MGDLLIQAHLVTAENVAEAMGRQAALGGRLGDNLVASSSAFLASPPTSGQRESTSSIC